MAFTYTLTSEPTTILRSDGVFVPTNPTNADYQDYLAWVAAGNTPTPLTPPSAALQAFAQLAAQDALMFRALEVLIDILLAKGVIAGSDFSATVRNLYLARKSLRTTAGVP